MLQVGIILFPDFQLLDATGPIAVFEAAGYIAGRGDGYVLTPLSADGGPVRSSAGVDIGTLALADAPALDTVLVPGGRGTRNDGLDPRLLELLRREAAAGRRLASVCTGAFLLARAGLLEGRRATTHWRHAAALARHYPQVTVLSDRIWVRDGALWTSAGVSAGIDLALALVSEDYGREVARRAAQEVVVYFQRPGGQSQFSSLEALDATGRFSELIGWIRANIARPLRIDDLAARVAMSPRNFSRRFREEVGRTPGQAVAQLRLEAARTLVESTRRPMEVISREVGYGDPETMRRAFVKSLGRPPRALRTAINLQTQSWTQIPSPHR